MTSLVLCIFHLHLNYFKQILCFSFLYYFLLYGKNVEAVKSYFEANMYIFFNILKKEMSLQKRKIARSAIQY